MVDNIKRMRLQLKKLVVVRSCAVFKVTQNNGLIEKKRGALRSSIENTFERTQFKREKRRGGVKETKDGEKEEETTKQ